jgi:hypothetical protein
MSVNNDSKGKLLYDPSLVNKGVMKNRRKTNNATPLETVKKVYNNSLKPSPEVTKALNERTLEQNKAQAEHKNHKAVVLQTILDEDLE